MSNRQRRRHPTDEDRIATQKVHPSRLHTIRQRLVQIEVDHVGAGICAQACWGLGNELDEVVEMIDDLLLFPPQITSSAPNDSIFIDVEPVEATQVSYTNHETINIPFGPTCVKCQYAFHSLSPWIPCADHQPITINGISRLLPYEEWPTHDLYDESCTHEDEGTEVGHGLENIERTYYGCDRWPKSGYGYKYCPDCGLNLEFDESLREDDTQREPL